MQPLQFPLINYLLILKDARLFKPMVRHSAVFRVVGADFFVALAP